MRKSSYISFWFFPVIILIPLIWVFCDRFGWLTTFEYATLNWRYDLRGEINAPVNLIYLDIDSKSMNLMGERPVPRTFFANAIEGLFKYGNPKVIGMDALFSDNAYSTLVDLNKAIEDTANLQKIIQENPRLVMAAKVVDEDHHLEGPEEKLIGETNTNINFGLINLAEHFAHGGITDWIPLYEEVGQKTYFTLAVEIVRIFYDLPKKNIKLFEDKAFLYKNDESVLMTIPLDQKKFVEVNWFSKWISPQNKRFSLEKAIEAANQIKSENSEQKFKAEEFYKMFDNAVVLIGEVDPLFNNMAPTPFDEDPVPKIGIHGNLVKTLITKKFLERPSAQLNIIILFALTLITSFPIAFLHKKGVFIKILGVGVIPLYLLASVYFFDKFNWILPIIGPLGAALSTSFILLIIQIVNIEKQRKRIKNMFGTYISPDLVNDMIDEDLDPQLGGEEKMITALFSDIENFSLIAESLSPNALIELINEYLSEMTVIIQEEKGTLDKYVGDAIISMFGAPVSIEDHALAACRTACRIQLKQLKLCEKWRTDKRKWPESVLTMKTRFGISTGLAIIGNMGSKIRFNYTMLGDNVNLASRCEHIGKTYGVYSVATDITRKWAENKDGIVFRFLDRILLDGKTEIIEIHEVVGFRKDLDEKTKKCIEIYSKGITSYFEGDWDSAIAYFEQSVSLEPSVDKKINPSILFLQRTNELRLHNPEGPWNGIFKAPRKRSEF